MCKISSEIKLASCKTTDITKLKYYWLLLRKNDGIFESSPIKNLPVDQIENDKNHNYRVLKKALNGTNSIYTKADEQKGDKLLLFITCKAHKNNFIVCFGDYAIYSFVYKNLIWEKCGYKPVEIINNIISVGKILHPFPLKSKKEKQDIIH